MKINEFLKDVKEAFVENIDEIVVVRKYIPILEKKMIVRDVLDRCTEEINGYIVVDGTEENFLFKIAQVKAYTCLEFSDDYEEMIEEYDALCKDEWFDIFERIISRDIKEFYCVMESEKNMLLKTNCIEAQVAKIVGNLVEAIRNIDLNSLIPEGTDLNNVLETLNKLK